MRLLHRHCSTDCDTGEAIRIREQVVLFEGVTIGKCDRCGHRYWPAEVLKRAEFAAEHPEQASRIANVPYFPADLVKRAERIAEHPEQVGRMASVPILAA